MASRGDKFAFLSFIHVENTGATFPFASGDIGPDSEPQTLVQNEEESNSSKMLLLYSLYYFLSSPLPKEK